jgi:peptide methionine sulfoxide reductase MsrA
LNNLLLTDVYFGVGCFWHIQHEFVEAERRLLSRLDNELTSLAGYAGGTRLGDQGRVCYHNVQFIADYGRLGHEEVVGMKIPESSIGDFAREYFSLFSPSNERVDPGDVGPKYRSLIRGHNNKQAVARFNKDSINSTTINAVPPTNEVDRQCGRRKDIIRFKAKIHEMVMQRIPRNLM